MIHKTKNDPLNNEELASCLFYFTADTQKTMHKDVRVPNICFNETFDPVLIDFDFSI